MKTLIGYDAPDCAYGTFYFVVVVHVMIDSGPIGRGKDLGSWCVCFYCCCKTNPVEWKLWSVKIPRSKLCLTMADS